MKLEHLCGARVLLVSVEEICIGDAPDGGDLLEYYVRGVVTGWPEYDSHVGPFATAVEAAEFRERVFYNIAADSLESAARDLGLQHVRGADVRSRREEKSGQ